MDWCSAVRSKQQLLGTNLKLDFPLSFYYSEVQPQLGPVESAVETSGWGESVMLALTLVFTLALRNTRLDTRVLTEK